MSLSHYLLWRIAAARYGRRPWQLAADERKTAESQAAREHRVITCALVASEAADIHADDDVVQAAVSALSEGYGDRTVFVSELAEGGLSEEGLYRAVADELRAGLVLERMGGAAVVTEEEVRAWYEARRAQLVTPERRAARHILITVNDQLPENTSEKARERLAEVAGALAAGAGFEAMALRHSECPSSLDGGRLGEVRRGQLYPELDAALFALEPGGIAMAESPLGMHLLLCDSVIPEQAMSYEAAAPSIRKRLESTARERVLKAWLAGQKGEEKALSR